MNKKEIKSMTDEELRISATYLLGATDVVKNKHELLVAYWPGRHNKYNDGWFCVGNYPIHMSAAWALVLKAENEGYSCVIYGPGGLTDECLGGGAGWEVQFQRGRWCDDDGVWYKGYDDELCGRAITRAFIMAMDGDENG